MQDRTFLVLDAEMGPVLRDSTARPSAADSVPCVLALGVDADLLAAFAAAYPASASSANAFPADPSNGAPAGGEADVVGALDGGAGSDRGRHGPASSTTNDAPGVRIPEGVPTA